MTEEKAFLVINAIPNPENMDAFQEYMSKIMSVLANAGGKTLGRYRTIEQVVGEGGPRVSGLVEFPNAGAIKDLIAGEEYNSLSQIREKAFKRLDLMISQAM